MNSLANTLPLDQILEGDCLEVLKGLPDNSVDLVFADPPYNLQLRNDLYRPNRTKVAAVAERWDKFASFADYDRFTRSWLSACRRVLKDNGTLWVIGTYHNIYRVGSILQDLGYWILNDIVWIKTNPMPNFRGVRFTNAHETLIWAQKKKGARYTFHHHAMKALNDDLQMRSDWTLPLVTGGQRLKINGSKAHPTQKPEALLYRILLATTIPGDVVLDPFFGTGTTGAVAKKLGRRWIGIERNRGYIRIARKRMDTVEPGDLQNLDINKPKPARIPFAALVEHGLLVPGQFLYFSQDGKTARVLANGHLRYGNSEGSIHQVASAILKAPANGWDFWLYETNMGKKISIDTLRKRLQKVH